MVFFDLSDPKRIVLYAKDNDKIVYVSTCQNLNFLPYFH